MEGLRYAILAASVLTAFIVVSVTFGFSGRSRLNTGLFFLANATFMGSFLLSAFLDYLPPLLGLVLPQIFIITGLILSVMIVEHLIIGWNRSRLLLVLVPFQAMVSVLFTYILPDADARRLIVSLNIYLVCSVAALLLFLSRKQRRSRTSLAYMILYLVFGHLNLMRGLNLTVIRDSDPRFPGGTILSLAVLFGGFLLQIFYNIILAQAQLYEQVQAAEAGSRRRIRIMSRLGILHDRVRTVNAENRSQTFDELTTFLKDEFAIGACILFHSDEQGRYWVPAFQSGVSRGLQERDDLADILFVGTTAAVSEVMEMPLGEYPSMEHRDLLFSEGWRFFAAYPFHPERGGRSVLVTSWWNTEPDGEDRLLMRSVSRHVAGIMENLFLFGRLRQIQGRYRSYFDLAFQAVVVFDRQGRSLEANIEASRLLKASFSYFSDSASAGILEESDRARFRRMIAGMTPGKAASGEYRFLTEEDGSTVRLHTEVRLIDSGGQDSFYAVLTPVSEGR